VTTFDPNDYGPVFAELLQERRLPPLDAGRPDLPMRARLEAVNDGEAFRPHAVRDPAMAAACRAGTWLLHDFLDEAHVICQAVSTAEGSYWHALVHRREPDFANSGYWFRRVGTHPIFEPLRRAAAELAVGPHPTAAFLATQKAWDPYAFLGLCEAVLAERSPCETLCRQVQRAEWDLLFDWCYRAAIAG
jgi:hypothetical protein